MNLADFNARWMYPDQPTVMPPYTGGGILGGGEQQPSGILGGGGFSQLLDPQVAIPIAAQLIGGRNFQQSLSGAAAAAAQAIPDAKRRAALNAWIKANVGWSHLLANNQRLETSPVYILTASEVFVARAEAAERSWSSAGSRG